MLLARYYEQGIHWIITDQVVKDHKCGRSWLQPHTKGNWVGNSQILMKNFLAGG